MKSNFSLDFYYWIYFCVAVCTFHKSNAPSNGNEVLISVLIVPMHSYAY